MNTETAISYMCVYMTEWGLKVTFHSDEV